MKIILFIVAFCVVITTATAQNLVVSSPSADNKPEEQMDPKNNIAGNIFAFTRTGVFYKSLNICGLVQTFNDPGPLTVFLPADSAFNKLPPEKLDALITPGRKYDLIAMITYHALPGKVSAKNIAKEIGRGKGLAVFRTISGAPLKARFESGNIVLIDETGGKSILQKSDLKQKNGLIHLVSAVLVPKTKPI
jgi:uncharacterized surface protein with fasciclin (FAS1) repeats